MATHRALIGNCAEVLKTLPSESIDCCVTSPPYWGLRDYKTEPIDWHDGYVGQLGLEPSPQLYIKHLVSIFDEVKRVLKPTGTCWVNLGDSYGDKSLQQIPSRFAIAMTDHEWHLRNELIWHKPNCMPSSVKDRFTVDFEKFFFFTKSKRYYFEAQYEPMSEATKERDEYGFKGAFLSQFTGSPNEKRYQNTGRPIEEPHFYNERGRNKRCVWTISTKPYSGAHFAVFPPELIETPIKAGCPTNGTVLDPFGGSGTTAKVARSLGRSSIIIELNPDYLELQNERALLNVPDITEFQEAP